MTLRDYTANVISASKVVPDGAFQSSAASGVWDINEALDLIKGGNWPTTGNIDPASFVDNLFQIHIYDGNTTGTTATNQITNGIDLANKGGLVWIKRRDGGETASHHALVDTVRGGTKELATNSNAASLTADSSQNIAFNNNGFTITGYYLKNALINYSGSNYVSWTFRKQPKFFDIQTYTGDGTNGRSVSHDLGSTPGMIILKRTDASSTDDWQVFHRYATNKRWEPNNTDAAAVTTIWGSGPTSTNFTVDNASFSNESGATYIAYLFAHNNNDGGFGEPGDQDIIKCGNYTTDSNEDATIDLGFEPQFVMFKRADSSTGGDWNVYDTMRGMQGDFLSQAALLEWNTTDSEDSTTNRIAITPTGFKVDNYGASRTYIYMAIRRGGMQTPTTATDVFDVNTHSNNSNSNIFNTGFNPDMNITTRTAAAPNYILSRLTGRGYLQTELTDAEVTSSGTRFWDKGNNLIDLATNWWGQNDVVSWSWKRARGYFDVVTWAGTGSARTQSHNLSVVPEMMWVRPRNLAENWAVYHKDVGATKYLQLNSTNAAATSSTRWNDTTPTSSVFSLGADNEVNATNYNYIGYLFATVAGVSKVGSYTGNDTGQNIDCGFSSGARFVLIKCSSHGDRSWMVFDSVRGIVAGADPFLTLEANSAENYASNGAGSIQNYSSSNLDLIDPYSSGFAVVGGTGMVNENGKSYIFYAIA